MHQTDARGHRINGRWAFRHRKIVEHDLTCEVVRKQIRVHPPGSSAPILVIATVRVFESLAPQGVA